MASHRLGNNQVIVMTQLLYHEHPYEKKFEATIISINGNEIILDKTLFYPEGGGQPTDTGTIRLKENIFNVIKVSKKDGQIIHTVDKIGLNPGNNVECELDWERRYQHMRMHTAQHLVSAIVLDDYGANTAGNQINWPTSRIDFEFKPTEEQLHHITRRFNELIENKIEVRSYSVPREMVPHEVKEPKRLTLFNRIPEAVTTIRIAEIVGVDKNPCGGVQVHNTKEIGHIHIEKTENVGKGKTRLIYSLLS